MDIEVKKAKGEFLGVHGVKKITVAVFLDEYLTWASVNRGANTYALNRFCADRLREGFSGYLSRITAKQVEEYKVRRRKIVSPTMVNREIALLKHMCTKVMEWGYLKTNPLNPVKFLKEPPGRLRYLTREEMEALIAACPPRLKRIVVVAMPMGMRKCGILGLKWSDIDVATKTITVPQTKNTEPKAIPMNQTLYQELQRHPRHLYFAYVFCNAQGEPYDEVKRSFNTACRKAGINGFRFHDLRHTFCSHLGIAGVPLQKIKELAGHRNFQTTLLYAHLEPDHLKGEVTRLPFAKGPEDASPPHC